MDRSWLFKENWLFGPLILLRNKWYHPQKQRIRICPQKISWPLKDINPTWAQYTSKMYTKKIEKMKEHKTKRLENNLSWLQKTTNNTKPEWQNQHMPTKISGPVIMQPYWGSEWKVKWTTQPQQPPHNAMTQKLWFTRFACRHLIFGQREQNLDEPLLFNHLKSLLAIL